MVMVKGVGIVLSDTPHRLIYIQGLVAIAKRRCCHMSRASDNDDAP